MCVLFPFFPLRAYAPLLFHILVAIPRQRKGDPSFERNRRGTSHQARRIHRGKQRHRASRGCQIWDQQINCTYRCSKMERLNWLKSASKNTTRGIGGNVYLLFILLLYRHVNHPQRPEKYDSAKSTGKVDPDIGNRAGSSGKALYIFVRHRHEQKRKRSYKL